MIRGWPPGYGIGLPSAGTGRWVAIRRRPPCPTAATRMETNTMTADGGQAWNAFRNLRLDTEDPDHPLAIDLNALP